MKAKCQACTLLWYVSVQATSEKLKNYICPLCVWRRRKRDNYVSYYLNSFNGRWDISDKSWEDDSFPEQAEIEGN